MFGFVSKTFDWLKRSNSIEGATPLQGIALGSRLSYVRRQSLGRLASAFCLLVGLGCISSADTGLVYINPSSATLSGTLTTYTCPSTTYPIGLGAHKTGTTSYGWGLFAKVSSTNGPETSVVLNCGNVVSAIYGTTATNGLNPSIQVGGSGPGTIIFTGTDSTSNGYGTIFKTGLTVTVPAYSAPGTYTGTITFTESLAAPGSTQPNPTSLTYSYTVPQNGQVLATPNSIPASSFTMSGAMVFTAPTSSVGMGLIAVTPTANTWSMKAYVSSHNGPETSVVMNTAVATQSVYSGVSLSASGSPSLPLGGSSPGTLIASGNTTTLSQAGPTTIFTNGLAITVPPTATPGTYTGTVTVTLTFNSFSTTTTLSYTYTVPTYVSVNIDQGLNFVVSTPGSATGPSTAGNFPNTYSTIGLTSNTAYHVTASVSSLTYSSSTIPTSQLWLGIDQSPSLASTAASNAVTAHPTGLASIRYPSSTTLPAGLLSLYLSGQVMTSITNVPGVYSGTITVTITAG